LAKKSFGLATVSGRPGGLMRLSLVFSREFQIPFQQEGENEFGAHLAENSTLL
jgi:hypothetical protein